MTEGHAQELKTQALALQVGKRLRVILSDNNAGIDDVLLGGVVPKPIRRLSTWPTNGPPMAGTCSTLDEWRRLRPDRGGAASDGEKRSRRPAAR